MEQKNLQSAATAGFHPVHACYDGIFNTVSGIKVDLLMPTLDMININDISHALSRLCRFGGHSRYFYSVAQHSVLVARLSPQDIRREALLHDAAEAYVGDIIKPLKVLLGNIYEDIEQRFTIAISEKFGLIPENLLQVKKFDKVALDLEHKWLQLGNHPTPLFAAHDEYGCNAWWPDFAHNVFLAWCNEYNIK